MIQYDLDIKLSQESKPLESIIKTDNSKSCLAASSSYYNRGNYHKLIYISTVNYVDISYAY